MFRLMMTTTVIVMLLAGTVFAASVQGYTRKDGTYVQPHQRSAPDSNPSNNYGFPGNYNPNTGQTTPGSQDSYLDRYYKSQQPSSNTWPR